MPDPDTRNGADTAPNEVSLLREMLRIRRFEEACAEQYSAGRIRGFLHLADGEEGAIVGTMSALAPDDPVVATYREHGHALARGTPARAIMAELFGRVEGCSRGRGGSMHLFDAERELYGGHAIVGAGLPVAVGIALADRLTGRGGRVTACFLGDGTAAEGAFQESLNLAALWDLGVLFVCQNNGYAMGTRIERALATTDIAARAAALGVESERVDGMDVLAVRDAALAAAARVRAGEGPRFLELETYRFRAHSMFDPERYRSREEVAAWRERDPIGRLTATLRARGELTDHDLDEIGRRVEDEVADAVRFAARGGLEAQDDLERDVLAAPPR